VRTVLVRSARTLLALLGAVVAAVGGLSLGGAGLVAVALAAVVAAGLAAGIAREGGAQDPRQAGVDAAWRAAVGTVTALLLLRGCVVLAGAALTALVVVSVLGLLLVRWAVRAARADRAGAPAAAPSAAGRPVSTMSVPALGEEWVHSSAELGRVRDPRTRQELVRRRQEALDELERRDPAGFGRWLDDGATVDSDPAAYVSGDPAAGSEAA
jgi:hypothetical protein